MERKLDIQNTMDVTSRGETVEVNLEAFDKEVLVQAMLHGLKQKIADSASAALSAAAPEGLEGKELKAWGDENADAVKKVTRDLMDQAVTRLRDEGWTAQSRGGSGRSDVEKEMIRMVRPQLKGRVDGYADLTPAKRDNAVWDELQKIDSDKVEAVRKMAVAEIKRRNETKVDLGDL